MKDKCLYYWERGYPYIVSVAIVVFMYKKNINFMPNTDLKEVLNGIVTLNSIILGFLGAIMPVILSMKNESKFVKYVFQKDKNQLFVKYLKVTIFMGLLNVVCSLLMHLRKDFAKYPKLVLYYFWIFTTVTFLLLTYRCMSRMIMLIFKPDSEREDKQEDTKQTRLSESKQKELRERYK